MFYKLNAPDYNRVRPLLTGLDNDLVLYSILDGLTPGYVFADDPAAPSTAFIGYEDHLFLAGKPNVTDFNRGLRTYLMDTLFPEAQAAGQIIFILQSDSKEWDQPVEDLLAGRYPILWMRQYYEAASLLAEPEAYLQPEFCLRPVDGELLSHPHLENIDELREELCSERPSVEDFLKKSFGFCIQREDEIVSWCLSEYNTGDRCEVGIATREQYQRRGLGTAAALALVKQALAQGYHRIGWHCWKSNLPSAGLAQKAGFAYVEDYPVSACFLNLAEQFGMHGNTQRSEENYTAALEWYEKSMALENTPVWVYFNAARCLALTSREAEAIERLKQAMERGLDDVEIIRSQPDFISLHGSQAWKALFEGNIGSESTLKR